MVLQNQKSTNPQDSTINSSTELSLSERQDLQDKVTKLLALLDEYFRQMQTMVSSLDEVMGPEAAKPYTALALQTIPQHFRCLRDAIGCQIQVTRKSLEEQDNSDSKGAGISRLCYTDQRPRQQRALQ
ncbi:Homeobox domain containing protein [Musa troglodytarum]|uniref:Homeobox domain containing protein n=1 Tax=Musa troglodytarum TaxID=320322 RepID=A0A9E7F1M3_9LILI|nr:Homeobox domain containing protein [Musa troglodytarum]